MRLFFLLITVLGTSAIHSQNVQSLLSGKNINSTFSIIAIDKEAKEIGVAVATNNIYVGASTIHIDPEVGGFTIIAETEPDYAKNGFRALTEGKGIMEAIEITRRNDRSAYNRQVAGIDIAGNRYAFTGSSVKYWKGNTRHIIGSDYIVIGNQLADSVLVRMASTFDNTKGSLSFRLLESLIAGQINGGQISGKRSAALVVKGQENEWYNQVDVRIDNSDKPIRELQRIYDYQQGRIALNQAQFAIRSGNTSRAKSRLRYGESLLVGWDGMYGKIAMLYSILEDDDNAVKWINKALLENVSWRQNISTFYYLRNHPGLKASISEDEFSLADWENATQMLVNIGRANETSLLINRLAEKGMESTVLYHILARIQIQNDQNNLAKISLKKSLDLDGDNSEALRLLKEIKQ